MADSNHLPPVRFEMNSDPRYLCAARALASSLARRSGFTEHLAGQIGLVVDEALCNVIIHGYDRRTDGRISIHLWPQREPQGLRVVVEDRARQVDPAEIKPRDLDEIRPGGLGVHIIREIMDDVRYEQREDGGMRLTMLKNVPIDEPGVEEQLCPPTGEDEQDDE